MTSDDPRKRFLELESQADELVKALEDLKNESENYQSATGHLDDLVKRIQETLDAMRSASTAMRETAKNLIEIGTPQILAAQEAQASAIAQLDSRLTTLDTKLDELNVQSRRSLLARLLTFH